MTFHDKTLRVLQVGGWVLAACLFAAGLLNDISAGYIGAATGRTYG